MSALIAVDEVLQISVDAYIYTVTTDTTQTNKQHPPPLPVDPPPFPRHNIVSATFN